MPETITDVQAAAAALGHLGGTARARNLSPERRKEIAQLAARARWAKVREQVAASRHDQGLPEHVTDQNFLGRLAREVTPDGGDRHAEA
jgi:hypothetical protein